MIPKTVRASILDILLDDDEGSPCPPGQITVDGYIASVARDIEHLLNCRNALKLIDANEVNDGSEDALDHGEVPEGPTVIDRSILMFGLPDFSALSLANGKHRQVLVDIVHEAITLFETRLTDVRVRMVEEPVVGGAPTLAIQATLRHQEFDEAVNFNARLQTTRLQFEVSVAKGRLLN